MVETIDVVLEFANHPVFLAGEPVKQGAGSGERRGRSGSLLFSRVLLGICVVGELVI